MKTYQHHCYYWCTYLEKWCRGKLMSSYRSDNLTTRAEGEYIIIENEKADNQK